MNVLSVVVGDREAAIRVRSDDGCSLADAERVSRDVCVMNRTLAETVWVWCWTSGMDERGPCAAFAVSRDGQVTSHLMDSRVLMSRYGRPVEA